MTTVHATTTLSLTVRHYVCLLSRAQVKRGGRANTDNTVSSARCWCTRVAAMISPTSRAFRALSTVSSLPSSPSVGARRRRHYRFSLTGSLDWLGGAVGSAGCAADEPYYYSSLVRIVDADSGPQPQRPLPTVDSERRESDELQAAERRAAAALAASAAQLDGRASSMAAYRQRRTMEREVAEMREAARRTQQRHIDGVLSAQRTERRQRREQQRAVRKEREAAARARVGVESGWLEGESEARGLNRRMERQKRSEAGRLRRQLALEKPTVYDDSPLDQQRQHERWLRRRDEDKLSSLEAAADALVASRVGHARTVHLTAGAADTGQAAHSGHKKAVAVVAVRRPLFDRRRAVESWQRDAEQQPRERQQARQRQRWTSQQTRERQRREEDRDSQWKQRHGVAARLPQTAAAATATARAEGSAGKAGTAATALSMACPTTTTTRSRLPVKQARAALIRQQQPQRELQRESQTGQKDAAVPRRGRTEPVGAEQRERSTTEKERLIQRLVHKAMEQCSPTSPAQPRTSSRSGSSPWTAVTISDRRRGESVWPGWQREAVEDGPRERRSGEAERDSEALQPVPREAPQADTARATERLTRTGTAPQQQQCQEADAGQRTRGATVRGEQAVEITIDGSVSGNSERVVIDGELNVHYVSQPTAAQRQQHSMQAVDARAPSSAFSRFPVLSASRAASFVQPSVCRCSDSPPLPSIEPQRSLGRLSVLEAARSSRASSTLSVRFASPAAAVGQRSLPHSAALRRPPSAFAAAVSLSLWQQPHLAARTHQPTHAMHATSTAEQQLHDSDTAADSGRSGSVSDPLQAATLNERRRQREEAVRQQQQPVYMLTADELLGHILAQYEASGGLEQSGCEVERGTGSGRAGSAIGPSMPASIAASRVAARGDQRRGGGNRPAASRRRSSVLMEEWKAREEEVELRQWMTSHTLLHDRWTTVVRHWQQDGRLQRMLPQQP